MHQRRGLSRVEVILVLLTVVVLAGLFLAGLGRIRAAADLLNCRNNLRQYSLAVQDWHDTGLPLPPLADQGPAARTGRGLPSVFANLAVFIMGSGGLYF